MGNLRYSFRPRVRRRQLLVEWIAIKEEYRRKGYATDVLTQLEIGARQAGAYRLGLAVTGDNIPALSRYSKLGFKPKNIFMAKPPSPRS